jgi:hypothetical protein
LPAPPTPVRVTRGTLSISSASRSLSRFLPKKVVRASVTTSQGRCSSLTV